MLNLIRSWLIEDKKTAKLRFDEVIQYNVKDFHLLRTSGEYFQYFLRIKNEKINTKAESVRGFITIENTKTQYKPLIWENNRQQYYDIGYQGDLYLFTITNNESGYTVNMHYTPPEGKERQDVTEYDYEDMTLEDSKNKNIIIQIDSNNASIPDKPYNITLEKLLATARKS